MTLWKGFKTGFSRVGQNVVTIVNTILLTFVYILGVGPSWLLAKLFGRRQLQMDLGGDSYWNDLQLGKKEREDYHRQF